MSTEWCIIDPANRRSFDLGKGEWAYLLDDQTLHREQTPGQLLGAWLPRGPLAWFDAVLRSGRATRERDGGQENRQRLLVLTCDLYAFAAAAGHSEERIGVELRCDTWRPDEEWDDPPWLLVGSRFKGARLDTDPLVVLCGYHHVVAMATIRDAGRS